MTTDGEELGSYPAPPTREEEFVLDHIAGIAVPRKAFEGRTNEYWQLHRLWIGMEYLYLNVGSFDAEIEQVLTRDVEARMGVKGPFKCDVFGGGLPLNANQSALVECGFDWYAISACQFVRLVGEVGHRLDPATHPDHGREYAAKVIPEVATYRDKVASHFVWVTQNKRDNDAERAVSIFPQLGFRNDTLVVSGWVLRKSSGANVSTSDQIKQWSLRKTHEQLRERYKSMPLMGQLQGVIESEGDEVAPPTSAPQHDKQN